MAMDTLWEKLPAGLLKKGYPAWCRLDWQVQKLVVKLASGQRFQCAFCPETRNLEIDHDHYPDEGPGNRFTIYNVRGLLCRTCNWHMGIYEADQAGSDRGWEHVYSSDISSSDYEGYIDAYASRQLQRYEDKLERTCPNYWSRRILLDKFDEWNEGWAEFPWRWGFEEIKEKRHGKIRTPRQFMNTMRACLEFIAEEHRKNPDWQPPESVVNFVFQAKKFFDKIRLVFEERLKASGYTITEDGRLVKPGAQRRNRLSY
jgi:hypothetical protein